MNKCDVWNFGCDTVHAVKCRVSKKQKVGSLKVTSMKKLTRQDIVCRSSLIIVFIILSNRLK